MLCRALQAAAMEDARPGSPSGTPEVTQPPRASFSPSSGGLAEINSTLRAGGAQNRYGQRSGAAMHSPAAPFNFDDAFNRLASNVKTRGHSVGQAPRFPRRSASRRLSADFETQKLDINFVPASAVLSSLAALRRRFLSALIKLFTRTRAGRWSCTAMRRVRARGTSIFATSPAIARVATSTKIVHGTPRRRRI